MARGELLADGNGVGDGPRRSVHGSSHSSSDVRDPQIEVHQDAAQLPPCEARREVGGEERRPRAPAWSVDGDHPSQRVTLSGSGSKDPGDRAGQLATIGWPEEEAPRSRLQGSSKGLHCLGRVHGEQRTSVQLCGGHESGRSDDGVGFQLPNGFGQLMLVRGGRHHPGPAGSVEEVHDFLGHIVFLEGEDHPRNFFHARSIDFVGRPPPTKGKRGRVPAGECSAELPGTRTLVARSSVINRQAGGFSDPVGGRAGDLGHTSAASARRRTETSFLSSRSVTLSRDARVGTSPRWWPDRKGGDR